MMVCRIIFWDNAVAGIQITSTGGKIIRELIGQQRIGVFPSRAGDHSFLTKSVNNFDGGRREEALHSQN